MIEKLIEATNWQMNVPKAYGPFHIIFLISALIITITIAFLIRKLNDKKVNILLLICGIFLLITEIYKNMFYYEVEIKYTGEYRWGIVSWQLCSMPMYLCLIIPFLKEGKIKQALIDFLATYNFLGGLIALIEPSGLFHPWVMITTHALIWHTMLIFIGFFLMFSGRACKKIKDFMWDMVVYYLLAIIAIIINLSLNEKSHGNINMFFLGFKGPNLPIYQNIFNACGWLFSTIVYTLTLSLAAFIVFIITYFIRLKIQNKKLVDD